MKPNIINPFALINKNNLVSESSLNADLQSTSSVRNEIPGQCPKCLTPMDTTAVGYASSNKSEDIFWCATCCVATPKPEA